MRWHGLMVVGICVVLALAAVGSEAVAGSEEDVAAIKRVREMEAASLNEADSSKVTSVYSADVEYIPPNEPALKGTDAVKGWVEAMLEGFDVSLEYTAADVKVLGDWAVEQYEGTATLKPKAGGDAMVEKARGIHVYHRGADGTWKITHDLWNYEAPHAAPE